MTDKIQDDHVVGYRFTMKDADDKLLEESGDHIAYYLHGMGTSPAGLEEHMAGRKVGDKFSATLEPPDAFGDRGDPKPIKVPRDNFPEDAPLEPGLGVLAESPQGDTMPLWIIEVTDSEVVLDPNHPLAGMTIKLDIEVVSIRPATEEEIAHGHTHEGGHHH